MGEMPPASSSYSDRETETEEKPRRAEELRRRERKENQLVLCHRIGTRVVSASLHLIHFDKQTTKPL